MIKDTIEEEIFSCEHFYNFENVVIKRISENNSETICYVGSKNNIPKYLLIKKCFSGIVDNNNLAVLFCLNRGLD